MSRVSRGAGFPRPKPVVLLILDGWGFSSKRTHNPIAAAATPCWDNLWQRCPHTLLQASGQALGLPSAQVGNSEVGHLTMGAGRPILQELTRIDQAIDTGAFFNNAVLVSHLRQARDTAKAVHVWGLLSSGGVHSHERHLHALLTLAAREQVTRLYLHGFLDGRDTPPRSAARSIAMLEAACQRAGCGQIVSLVGRYYAMDRDQRWERTAKAYALLIQGQADFQASTAAAALSAAYTRGETDEFLQATTIQAPHQRPVGLAAGDLVICMNFRADRMRQLTQALIDPHFTAFPRGAFPLPAACVSLTRYADDLATYVAFPPQPLENTLAQVLAERGLSQLRLAETEKYAHVTFFFSGGREIPYPGEQRRLIPSPKVATYNLKPEMSALEVTDCLLEAIATCEYDVIVCNLANPDMVAHTGDFKATVQAIETVDKVLSRIIPACQASGGEVLITADHGNAECLYDASHRQPHTAHTEALVPLIYVGRPAAIVKAAESGERPSLASVAPTLLQMLGLQKPVQMTGMSVIQFLA